MFRALILIASLGYAGMAGALEYRSIATDRTVMYDAPSLQAKKRFLAHRYYPVEVIVDLADFTKVRDISGDLVWVEKKALSSLRTVLVTVPVAQVLQKAEASAPVVFQAERGVALEMVEPASAGWLRVRHLDGSSGYVSIAQVWGL